MHANDRVTRAVSKQASKLCVHTARACSIANGSWHDHNTEDLLKILNITVLAARWQSLRPGAQRIAYLHELVS